MSDEPEREVPDGVAVFPLIPAELGIDPLLLAVVHVVVFLNGSDDGVVDPVGAEETLQYIATYLQRLNGARLTRIREDLETLAGYAKQQGWPKQEIRFVKEFLESFGVDEPEKGV